VAGAPTGCYRAERQSDGKFLAILDGCDVYGPAGTLRDVKDRCQALHEDREERMSRARR
jgi:hypothetical protein